MMEESLFFENMPITPSFSINFKSYTLMERALILIEYIKHSILTVKTAAVETNTIKKEAAS